MAYMFKVLLAKSSGKCSLAWIKKMTMANSCALAANAASKMS